MARRVFFSFHYDRDIFRVSQVRNSSLTKGTCAEAGYIDHPDWETLKRQGDGAIRRWIDSQMAGASVVAVLIGAETSTRPWVNYEIDHGHREGKGLFGIYIHQLKDPKTGKPDYRGRNPFEDCYLLNSNPRRSLNLICPTYDWIHDDGYTNFGKWVELAANKAGYL